MASPSTVPEGTLPLGPGLAFPPPAPVPPAPGHRRLALIVGGAIAAVAVIVLAILFATGAFSSHTGGPSGPFGPPLAYGQVDSLAHGAAANASGGPWVIVGAEGIGVSSAVGGGNAAATLSGGCTSTPIAGSPSSYTLDATPSDATPGEVAGWIFIAKNPSASSILMIAVNATAAVPLGLVSGCSLVTQLDAMASVTGLAVVNETVVVATFDQAGGSSFLTGQSIGIQAFVLFGSSSLTLGQAVWMVLYSTCSPTATGGTGTALVGMYSATTGVSIAPPTEESESC